jgi:hypothetical protein
MSDRRYIEIPGVKTHELPPLLVHSVVGHGPGLEQVFPEAEDMLPVNGAEQTQVEQRLYDLALQLSAQYKGLVSVWQWGNSVLDWVRQCEITFECEDTLRKLLHPDVWPHASRASFVTLLLEKRVPTGGIALERAVGLRLAFRQPPPIDCFSSEFLFYLNSTMADSAYQAWSQLSQDGLRLLPPERFHFEVIDIN